MLTLLEKSELLMHIGEMLTNGKKTDAREIIVEKYPFTILPTAHRSYNERQKMEVFMRDGFIDRYTGERLINPGFLKVLSFYYPVEFPYQSHWKMTECHDAYWELCPTIDHLMPIARGGMDTMGNWVTTSMLNNSIKSNWTLDQLHWNLHEQGKTYNWDGLSSCFISLVAKHKELLNDGYINKWYKVCSKYSFL